MEKRKKKYDKNIYPIYEKTEYYGERFVIVSKDGTLGFYKRDSSRHFRRTVLAFKFRKTAENFLIRLRNTYGIEGEIESRKVDFYEEGNGQYKRVKENGVSE